MDSISDCKKCGNPIPIFSRSQTICYECLTKSFDEKNTKQVG